MLDLSQDEQDRLIAERERRQITGISRAHRWRLERARKFPLRLSLGPKTVRWRLREVLAWMDSLPPVEGSPKPIPKSANLRPRVSKRTMSEAKDRASPTAASDNPPPKRPKAMAASQRRKTRGASSNAQPTAAE